MLLSASKPLVTRTASSATTTAKLVSPTAASTKTGLRGSRASRYRPNHQLSEKTTADSAAMVQVSHYIPYRPSRLHAVTAVTGGVVAKRAQEVDPSELRPIGLREPHLGVRALPQQEARQPLLPRGADHQIGVGHAGGVQVFRDRLGGDGLDQLVT